MIVLVTGPDAFLVRAELNRVRSEIDPDGFNTSTLDGRAVTIEEIVAALGTPAFFGSQRLVIVSDLMTATSKTAAASEVDESPSGRGTVDWSRIFEAIEPGNSAIFVDRELLSVPAVKRAAPKTVGLFAGDPPRGSELVNWMKARAVSMGSGISDIEARYLAGKLCPDTWATRPNNPVYDRPPDLDQFAGEIDKLALYADGSQINRTHINEMTSAAQPDRLFPLIDAFVGSDSSNVVRELEAAVTRGDDIGRVNAQLMQQIELMAALAAAGSHTEPAEFGKSLGLTNPNRMFAISKSLGRLRVRPSALLGAALHADRTLKTGEVRQPVDQTYGLVDESFALVRQTRQGGT